MKNRIVILWFLGIASFAVGASNYAESLLLPAVAAEFTLEIPEAGMVITLYLAGFGFSTIFSGPLADRYGKVEVIIISLFFFIVSLVLSSTAATFALFLIFRTLSGIFAAAVLPVSNALICDLFLQEERQSALGLFQSLSFLGQSACMIAGGAVTHIFDWRSVFQLISFVSAVSIVLLALIRKHVPPVKNLNGSFLGNYVLVLSPRINRMTYLVISAGGALIMGLSAYLGSFIKFAYNYDYLVTGLILTAFGMAMLVFTGISSKLASRWGQKKMLLAGYAAGLVSNIFLLLGGNVIWLLVAATIFLGQTFLFAHVTLITMVSEFSATARGAALSLVACTYMVGGGLGTAAGGYIIERAGYQPLFLTHCIVYIILIVLIGKFLRLTYSFRHLPRSVSGRA